MNGKEKAKALDEEERKNDNISETYGIPYADFCREFPCSAMALDKFIKQGCHFKETKKRR